MCTLLPIAFPLCLLAHLLIDIVFKIRGGKHLVAELEGKPKNPMEKRSHIQLGETSL